MVSSSGRRYYGHPEMGPVQIAEGSHAEGLIPVYRDSAGLGKTGAYALFMDRVDERLAKYDVVAPLPKPGDLILMDFLTMHQGGHNVSKTPRWSIQFRYFNFAEHARRSHRLVRFLRRRR